MWVHANLSSRYHTLDLLVGQFAERQLLHVVVHLDDGIGHALLVKNQLHKRFDRGCQL